MKQARTLAGERALIQQIRRASESRPKGAVRLGIGDDCAILRIPRGHEMLVTTDLCLEQKHFRRDWHTPESAGHRCLARGLSDLAAMGATPVAAFLSLALPAGTAKPWPGGAKLWPGDAKLWVDGFLRGLLTLAERSGVPLAGGDTSESPSDQVLADIVLVGSAPAGKALLRSGARAGDLIYVTGQLGGSAAELQKMRAGERKGRTRPLRMAAGDHPQSFPEPRLAVGRALLRRSLATACIDVSDGLSTDLNHLCEESSVSARIELARIPIHPLAKGMLDLALHGGEDYELLFAARPNTHIPARFGGVPVTCIGAFTKQGRDAICAPEGQRNRCPQERDHPQARRMGASHQPRSRFRVGS